MNRGNLHVLHVLPQLGPGGIELALAQLSACPPLDTMRHTIVAMRGENLIADRLREDIDVHLLRARPNEMAAAWRLRRLVQHLGPGVVHARNWGSWDVAVLARAATTRRTPLIYSFHGQSEDRWPWRRRAIARVLARFTSNIFTVTQHNRLALAQDLGMPVEAIGVIPNGVDTQRFRPTVHAGGPPVVGTVGNLTSVKNHELLVRAFAAMQQQAPTLDAHLRIAGEGPLRGPLERLIVQLGLEEHCQLVGRIHDVPGFLAELDMFVLPSRSEAHPNALLEAMASGLPCLATKVGGVGEVLDGGCCGRLVPPGNVDALATGMLDLLQDHTARCQLGRLARTRAYRFYSLTSMAQAYAELYEQAAGRPTVIPISSMTATVPCPADKGESEVA